MHKSIEGIPVIIRFKTFKIHYKCLYKVISIEGIPVIIRFKTPGTAWEQVENNSIEGIPVIIRFKTTNQRDYDLSPLEY